MCPTDSLSERSRSILRSVGSLRGSELLPKIMRGSMLIQNTWQASGPYCSLRSEQHLAEWLWQKSWRGRTPGSWRLIEIWLARKGLGHGVVGSGTATRDPAGCIDSFAVSGSGNVEQPSAALDRLSEDTVTLNDVKLCFFGENAS